MFTLGVAANWYSQYEKQYGVPQKLENRNTIWLRNSTPKYLPEEKENINLKRAIMHPYVNCILIYNKQDMEAI